MFHPFHDACSLIGFCFWALCFFLGCLFVRWLYRKWVKS